MKIFKSNENSATKIKHRWEELKKAHAAAAAEEANSTPVTAREIRGDRPRADMLFIPQQQQDV